MRPKLILLLVLAIGSAAFLAVLLHNNAQKNVCEKECSCPQCLPTPGSGGSDDMFEGSFNHLIVSTIK